MPPPKAPTRSQQLVTGGLGKHFTSPQKRRDKKKSTTYVEPIGQDTTVRLLKAKLEKLKRSHLERVQKVENLHDETTHVLGEGSELAVDIEVGGFEVEMDEGTIPDDPLHHELPHPLDDHPPPRRVLPDGAATNLYQKWSVVLPRLIEPHLEYITASAGKALQPTTTLHTTCFSQCGPRRTSTVLCLFQDREPSSFSTHRATN